MGLIVLIIIIILTIMLCLKASEELRVEQAMQQLKKVQSFISDKWIMEDGDLYIELSEGGEPIVEKHLSISRTVCYGIFKTNGIPKYGRLSHGGIYCITDENTLFLFEVGAEDSDAYRISIDSDNNSLSLRSLSQRAYYIKYNRDSEIL